MGHPKTITQITHYDGRFDSIPLPARFVQLTSTSCGDPRLPPSSAAHALLARGRVVQAELAAVRARLLGTVLHRAPVPSAVPAALGGLGHAPPPRVLAPVHRAEGVGVGRRSRAVGHHVEEGVLPHPAAQVRGAPVLLARRRPRHLGVALLEAVAHRAGVVVAEAPAFGGRAGAFWVMPCTQGGRVCDILLIGEDHKGYRG